MEPLPAALEAERREGAGTGIGSGGGKTLFLANDPLRPFKRLLRVKLHRTSEDELFRVFLKYDTDHNGLLNEYELSVMLTDLYMEEFEKYKEEGAPRDWVVKAEAFLHSDKFKEAVKRKVDQMFRVRTARSSKRTMDWGQFSRGINYEEEFDSLVASKLWKFTPLLDINISDLDNLVDPWQKAKVVLAGATGLIVAKTVVSPLSRLTILLQTSSMRGSVQGQMGLRELVKTLYRTEGWRGFFRGNATDLVRSGFFGALNYFSYEQYKSLLMNNSKFLRKNRILGKICASGITGVSSLLLVFPLDVVRTRLAAAEEHASTGFFSSFMRIYSQEGILSFYRGALVASIQSFPKLAIQFTMFDIIKEKLHKDYGVTFWGEFVAGAIAGGTAQVFMAPVDLIIVNMQLAGASRPQEKETEEKKTGNNKPKRAGNFRNITYQIWRNGVLGNAGSYPQRWRWIAGVKSFYKGFIFQTARTIPLVGINLMMIEQTKKLFGVSLRNQ